MTTRRGPARKPIPGDATDPQGLTALLHRYLVWLETHNFAAQTAGMHCVVTTNGYTEKEDFSQADMVVSELGEAGNVKVTLETVREIIAKG